VRQTRLAQTLSAKRFGNGGGFVVCGAGWSAKVLGVASGLVEKGRLCSTRVMEGERPFSVKILGNSQRPKLSNQSASAQVLTIFAQAQRPASGGQPA
jgi:hypothetical protein